MTELMTIGELSAATGVPDSTIRFWERRDLIVPATRRGGQRRYTPDDVQRVAVLRLCQAAGFTLAEIGRMKRERHDEPFEWRRLVTDKLADVQRRLTELDHARDLLHHALRCGHENILHCPGFQAAVRDGGTSPWYDEEPSEDDVQQFDQAVDPVPGR
ncbi:MerR family transcriptional regulator [Longispora sp. NPDC051575]|uniref:MerR family transcriptional regulator n=1 Tax=Longispora sp. NPDC051575 TaxID=3154943 RepID=UPI00343CD271